MAQVTMVQLLKAMVDQNASDLHLSAGVPPEFRISGNMVKVKVAPLSKEDTKDLAYSVMTDSRKAEFEAELEMDFSFEVPGFARFRANIMYQKGTVGAVFRRIPYQIPKFEDLGLPPALKRILKMPNGLVLVTGATGSGKSTSLAAMIDLLNTEEPGHILTIEDPIEFVHPHKSCVVNQREVGADTKSFGHALKRALRQDPDYILVGELRDLETIEMALTMAETGHLVFATLHTNSAVASLNRVINVFPTHQQAQVRQLMADTLRAVLSQQLIPNMSGTGRSLAVELMVLNTGLQNLIREDKLHQIYSMMQSGQGESGMKTMNQSLTELVKAKKIAKDAAVGYSTKPEEMAKIIQSMGGG